MAERLAAIDDAGVPEGVVSRFVGLNSTTAGRFPTGQHPCQGLYWTLADTTPSVALMFVHYSADFSEHYLAGPLAARGFGVLGWNTRFRGNEDMFILEKALDDISIGCRWLKEQAGAKKIVFIGNSGGGSLMTAYQGSAQEDPSLVGADAFIFLNAHPGRPNVLTKWLDPSVVDETDPLKTDPALDMYNPEIPLPYSEEFVRRYRAAQVERNHRITRWARMELKRLNEAGVPDRLFSLYRTMADLRFKDPTIDPSDRTANACYTGDPEKANRSIGMLGRTNSLKTWLSMWSLEESKSKLEPYAAEFKLPTLVIQGTSDAGVFPSDAQGIFNLVASKDKEIKMVPGGHFFDDAQDLQGVADVITQWVQKKT